MKKITSELLRANLHYCEKTGEFTWAADQKTGRGNGRLQAAAGTKAGGQDGRYMRIGLAGGRYWAHRLAFLWMTGEFPEMYVDHIDGDGLNNAWVNLRDVSPAVNMQNRKCATRASKHQLLGVTENHKRFLAQIMVNKKYQYIGTYDTPREAHEAYLKAKRELHEGNTL